MTTPHTSLLPGVSQFEVDFVIPRVGVDVPLGIDPFLLFKSRDAELSSLHSQILSVFDQAIRSLRGGDEQEGRYLLDFPEVSEVGLGYTRRGKRGAGVGDFLTQLIVETLTESSALMARGVRHIEEMQLVSVGIGPDRISDITANLIKSFLIAYTQRQCQLWNLPLVSGVPVSHIFDFETWQWFDGYFDLPISAFDNTPILLVPRRLVRALPWINYDDYFKMEFAAYLRKKRARSKLDAGKVKDPKFTKEFVAAVGREEIDRIDRYIDQKETTASDAQPSTSYLESSAVCPEAEKLRQELAQIMPGIQGATDYQCLVLKILNYLFSPELIDGETEVKTLDGTERRDIIFTNDSDASFWTYLRQEHSSLLLMFETKNTHELEINHLNQTAVYLGARLGYLGFIVTRNAPDEARRRKQTSIYNDSFPKKIILVLSDQDLIAMLDLRCQGKAPMKYMQRVYREFRQTAQ